MGALLLTLIANVLAIIRACSQSGRRAHIARQWQRVVVSGPAALGVQCRKRTFAVADMHLMRCPAATYLCSAVSKQLPGMSPRPSGAASNGSGRRRDADATLR